MKSGITNLLAYALTTDEPTPGWRWLMQNTKELPMSQIKSQTAKQVNEAAESLLAAVAGKLNQVETYPLTLGDIRQAIAAAMAESVGPGVVIVWWDEVSGLQVNVGGMR